MMTSDIHTCSYYCDRPACIRAQRDDLAARLTQPAASGEVVEGAVYHDGGVSLVRRGSEDDWCRERGAQRIYRNATPQPDADTVRLDYIERTFSGCTNRERYLPVQMIWGKGCNGRSLREACDKYMARDAAIDSAIKGEK